MCNSKTKRPLDETCSPVFNSLTVLWQSLSCGATVFLPCYNLHFQWSWDIVWGINKKQKIMVSKFFCSSFTFNGDILQNILVTVQTIKLNCFANTFTSIESRLKKAGMGHQKFGKVEDCSNTPQVNRLIGLKAQSGWSQFHRFTKKCASKQSNCKGLRWIIWYISDSTVQIIIKRFRESRKIGQRNGKAEPNFECPWLSVHHVARY